MMLNDQGQSVWRVASQYAGKGFWPLAGKAGTTVFSILLIGLLSRTLSLEQFGHYSLAMTVFFLLMYDYGLTGLMLRELGLSQNGGNVASLFTINVLMKAVAFFVGIVVGLLVYPELMGIMVPVSLGWLLYYLQEFRKTILFARLRTFQAAMGELLNKGLILAFTAAALMVRNDAASLTAVMLAFLLANILSYAYIHLTTRDFPLSMQPLAHLGPQWRDFKPIILLAGLGVILSRIDIVLLDHYRGAEAAGIFSLAERIRMSFVFLPATLVALLTPRLAGATGTDHRILDFPVWRRYQSVLFLLTSASWLCLLAAGIAASFIVGLLVGQARFAAFEASVMCLQILVVGGVGVFLTIASQSMITVMNKQSSTISLYALTLALKIGLSLFLIPLWGVVGAAWADAIAYLVCGVLLLRLYRSLYGKQLLSSAYSWPTLEADGPLFTADTPSSRDFLKALKTLHRPTSPRNTSSAQFGPTPLEPFRFLTIIDTLRPDGAQQMLVQLLRRLEEDGSQLAVIAIVEGGPLARELRKRGIPLLITGKPGIFSLSPLIAIMRTIRVFRPHIVHTHLFAADTYGRIASFLSRPSPLLVTTEHNINLDEGPLKRATKARLSRINTCMAYLNPQVMRYSLDVEGCRPADVAIISNGVDLDRFFRAENRGFGARSRPVRMLSVGRLMPQKGHDILIDAIRLVVDRGHTITVTIAGDGPLREPLQQQIEKQSLGGIITLAGHVPTQHMPELYQDHDVFCFPSRFEGQGIALIEAMACGLTVIATATGGIVDLVTHNHDGILVEDLDRYSLAEAIGDIVGNPVKAEELGRNAILTSRRYDLRVTLDHYRDLYRWMVGTTAVRPPCLLDPNTVRPTRQTAGDEASK